MTDKNKIKYNLRGIVTCKPSPAIKKIVDSLTPEDMDEAKKELEQEPVSEDLEDAAEDYCKSTLVGSHYIKKNAFKAGSEWQKEKKEPVSEDLEKAAKRYATEGDEISGLYIIDEEVEAFKAGANWQREKDRSITEDLEKASKEWLAPQLDKSYANYGETKQMELTHFDGYAMLDAIEFGAQWQKQQDQSTIELAEDHAMLAGMEKMKEQMMEKAIDAELYSDGMLTPIIKVNDKEKISDIKFGDKVKIIIIKEDKDE